MSNLPTRTRQAADQPRTPLPTKAERETLILIQAIFKAISGAVSTKDPASLRSRVDAGLLELYEVTGGKSFDLTLGGRKVGTHTIRFSKEVHRRDLVVADHVEFARWAWENGLARRQVVLTIDIEDGMPDDLVGVEYLITEETWRRGIARESYVMDRDAVLAQAAREGEIPDGCEVRAVDEPSRPIGTTLRVDPSLVARAMGDALPPVILGLLSEGGE